jgi:hypothetical protein
MPYSAVQPLKSTNTHSLVSGAYGNPNWILDFAPKKSGSLYTISIALRADNGGYTSGGLTLVLPRDLGESWGFQKQSCGNYWFQVSTHKPQMGLSLEFCRQFWDTLVSEGWKPLKEGA